MSGVILVDEIVEGIFLLLKMMRFALFFRTTPLLVHGSTNYLPINGCKSSRNHSSSIARPKTDISDGPEVSDIHCSFSRKVVCPRNVPLCLSGPIPESIVFL